MSEETNLELFYKDIHSFTEEEESRFLLLAVPERREALAVMAPAVRKASLCGEALAKQAIATAWGIAIEEIQIKKDPKGKPYEVNHPDIFFSISHSRDKAVCAVHTSAVGVDIEYIRPVNKRLFAKCCTDKEQRYVEKADTEEEMSRRFLTLWTLKESYLKYTGQGLSGGLKTAEFIITNGIISSNKHGAFSSVCSNDGYIISYCIL